MAVVAYLASRSSRGANQLINNVESMLLAIDDAVDTTPALIRARAVTVARAQGNDLPTGYFDTLTALSAFATAGEYVILGAVQKVGVT